jgi:hypothetical protein
MQNEKNLLYKKMQSFCGSLVNVHHLTTGKIIYSNALVMSVKYNHDASTVSYLAGYPYHDKNIVCIQIFCQEEYIWCVVAKHSVKLIQH